MRNNFLAAMTNTELESFQEECQQSYDRYLLEGNQRMADIHEFLLSLVEDEGLSRFYENLASLSA